MSDRKAIIEDALKTPDPIEFVRKEADECKQCRHRRRVMGNQVEMCPAHAGARAFLSKPRSDG